MTKISKEEIVHIARMSAIELKENEIDPLIAQIEQVLSYAQRVTQVATSHHQEQSLKNIKVVRKDLVVSQNPEPLLAQAPQRESNYFVVPKILDN